MNTDNILKLLTDIPDENFTITHKDKKYTTTELQELLSNKKLKFREFNFSAIDDDKDEILEIFIKEKFNFKDYIKNIGLLEFLLIAGMTIFILAIIIKFASRLI